MDGPSWPACRHWVASVGPIGPVAAVNSVVIIENLDPLDSGSLICIDWIKTVSGAAQDIVMGLVASGTIAYSGGLGPFNVIDVQPAPPGGIAKIANVAQGANNVLALTPGGYRFFSLTTTYETPPQWPGWTITPQNMLLIAGGTVNTQLSVDIGGRYYSAL